MIDEDDYHGDDMVGTVLAKPKRVTKQMHLDGSAIAEPGPDNYRCQQCQLHLQSKDPFHVPGKSSSTVIVSSSPIDIASQLWYDIRLVMFKKTGLSDKTVTYMTPTLCTPYKKKVTALQLRMCEPFVASVIHGQKPKRVIAMGVNSVKQLVDSKASIRGLIGSTLDYQGVPLYATYDPSAALADKPEFLVSIQRHLYRIMHGLTNLLPTFPGWKR